MRRFVALGDQAVVVELDDNDAAHGFTAAVERSRHEHPDRWLGVEDVVVGLHSVTVILDLTVRDPADVAGLLSELPAELPAGRPPAAGWLVEIPVTFDGPDLDDVAAAAGRSPVEVVELLTSTELHVAFVGFAPGFAYLVGLPPALAAVPRRPAPRPEVPAGSLGVAGGFAGFYPLATPGGWNLVGRTDMVLFDPTAGRTAGWPGGPPTDQEAGPTDGQPARLRAGDRIRLVGHEGRRSAPPEVAPPAQPTQMPPATRAAQAAPATPASSPVTPVTPATPAIQPAGSPGAVARRVVVEEPGLLSLVQDRGRVGLAASGVPRAGPADPDSHRLANLLVGNDEWEPAIEVTATGPTLRPEHRVLAAVVGDVAVSVDGRILRPGTVFPLDPGQRLVVGRVRSGLRATVAFAGGIAGPRVLGSASTDMLSGLGPGPLRAGTVLDLGPPGRARGRLLPDAERSPETWVGGGGHLVHRLRVMPGPDGLDGGTAPGVGDAGGSDREGREPTGAEWEPIALADEDERVGWLVTALTGRPWMVSETSDRVGLRLYELPGQPTLGSPPPVDSRALVTGAIQVPPDGHPIVALCDHGTVGGYPVAATVISAELGVLGRLAPGDLVSFSIVDMPVARRARTELERRLRASVVGWYPDPPPG